MKSHIDEFIRPLIGDFHGRVVKTLGDALLIEFASAVDAVQCAVAFQRGVERRAEGALEEKRIQFRIGINKALELLDRAIKLDPDFALAYAWKACVLGQAIQFGVIERSP